MSDQPKQQFTASDLPDTIAFDLTVLDDIDADYHQMVPFLKPAFVIMAKWARKRKLTERDILKSSLSVSRATAVYSLQHLGCPSEVSRCVLSKTIDRLDLDSLLRFITRKSEVFAENLALFWEKHHEPVLAMRVRMINGLRS